MWREKYKEKLKKGPKMMQVAKNQLTWAMRELQAMIIDRPMETSFTPIVINCSLQHFKQKTGLRKQVIFFIDPDLIFRKNPDPLISF